MTAHRAPRHAPVWLQGIGRGASFLLLTVSSLAAVVLIVIPMLTGSQTYSVLTGSMAPSYPPGTFLVVKPTEFDSLKTGDVVTYQLESGRPDVVTHRVIGFSAGQDGQRQLITQGDNNDVADENPVMDVQVRGKLFYAVPYVGFIANALGQTDRSGIVTALAIALIAFGAFTMIRGLIKDRREARNRQLIAEAPEEPATSATAPAPEQEPAPVQAATVQR